MTTWLKSGNQRNPTALSNLNFRVEKPERERPTSRGTVRATRSLRLDTALPYSLLNELVRTMLNAVRFRSVLTGGCIAVFATLALQQVFADPIQVLSPDIHPAPQLMMNDWYQAQTSQKFKEWDEKFATLKTPEAIEAYQKSLREKFVERIGGFPERTELNARVTGIVPRDGYRVEKILFESQPQHYVTGACFVPHSPDFKAPYPAVLIVCGHSNNGKAIPAYQSGAALLALNGIVAFLIDPICQGERYEHLKEDGSIELASTTAGHTLIGTGAILLGKNTARNEIWDGMRAIDYLQQREDVISDKIGCMGNSGGGTQTAYLMSLDDRIKAASPSCYITDFKYLLKERGPQDAEQNIFGQLDFGMDHADYLMMRAPTPILVCTASQDMFPILGSWDSYRKAKRLYSRLGYSERISLIEADGPHGWLKPLREASVEWMCRWLAGRDLDVREPELQLLTDQEFLVTDRGQVLQIEGARSALDLNLEEFKAVRQAQQANPKSPVQVADAVRRVTGIQKKPELPELPAKKVGESRDGDILVERWIFTPEPKVHLTALLYRPATVTKGPLLFLHPLGKNSSIKSGDRTTSAKSLAEEGHVVLSLELRGTGETQPEKATWYDKRFGIDGKHAATAYLLGKSYAGIWGNEILQAAVWLLHKESLPTNEQKLTLVAQGRLGVAALHAAAAEAEMFGNVQIFNCINSWETIIGSKYHEDQFINVIHGAALEYDLPDLLNVLKDKPEIQSPCNALGKM